VEYYYYLHGLLEKSKLVQHACEEDCKISWKEEKILQIKPINAYRKYKETAHMVLADHPINQPSFDLSHLDSYQSSRSQ
jgi:hypothetical protein